MDDEGNDRAEGGPAAPPAPPWGLQQPPVFEQPPGLDAPPAFGPGPAFGAPPPLPPPPVPPAWRRLIAPMGPVEGPRPAPTAASMVAVGGGLLAAAGLFALLSELDGYAQRTTGLAISLLFVALGVAISVVNRSSRAAAGGVALSIIGVVPFTVYVFANADLFDQFSGGEVDGNPWTGLRWTITLALITAAGLWLVGYLFVPTRRYGAFLGAALLAVWLIPLCNLQLSAMEDMFRPFESVSTFEPVPSEPG
ncbi:MAG TPA: hypothetical protein VNQ33_10040, partial [Acidimicrobiales bacterium]|nr:hypothetical protein [Acidimicrobiales bacterium]